MRSLPPSLPLMALLCALALNGCATPAQPPAPDYRVKVMPAPNGKGAVAVPPHCLSWAQDQMGSPWDNQASPTFGCATAQDLAAQVANPNDLIEGRPLGAPDPIVSAASVSRYQAGKTTALIDPNAAAPAQVIKMEDARLGGGASK